MSNGRCPLWQIAHCGAVGWALSATRPSTARSPLRATSLLTVPARARVHGAVLRGGGASRRRGSAASTALAAQLIDGPAPEAKKIKPPRTHWDMLMERRTIADLEEVLAERLDVLRARRGTKSA